VAAAVLALTGCAAETGSAEGGMGLPVVAWIEDPPAGNTPIAGTMLVATNGCFHLEVGTDHLFAVWPDGFEHDGDRVRTDNGTSITDGDPLQATGEIVVHDDAVALGGGKDSQLGSAIGYCAENLDVVVLSEVSVG
jgi:hypothetical protein